MKRSSILYLSTAAAAILCTMDSPRAQQAPAPSPAAQSAAPSTAQAAPPSAQLEEVVITAEKRTENLQDAPVAASVISVGKLSDANATELSDINKMVPSVNMNGTISGRVPLGIRGISSDSNEQTVGIASGVAINIDGIPVPSDSYAANQIEDVENVEVLKGPQSTLGGRTASAGEINIVTRKPTDTWTGSITGTVTDDNEQNLTGYISGPITDKLDMSIAGWGHHTDYPIVNLYDDKNTYQNNYGFRAKLLFKPTDDLDILLSTRLSATQTYGMNFTYSYITPGAHLLGVPLPFLSQAALLPGIKPSIDNEAENTPVTNSGAKIYDNDVSLDINYRLGDFTLSSTTAYQHESQQIVQDLFTVAGYFFTELTGGALPFPNYQTQWEDVSQTSEELKIVSPADRDISFVGGFFYSDTSVDESLYRDLVPAAVDINVIPDSTTYAVYGRGTWKITPTTAIVAGLRYNDDELSYKDHQYVYVPGGTNLYSKSNNSSSAVVGDISLQQEVMPDWKLYATYARGYAPKAYNTSAVLYSDAAIQPVDQETINHFELGSKGRYFDNKLEVNAALFDTIYDNYQIQTYAPVPGAVNPPLNLTSAGQAETRGVELDTAWKATPDLTVNFSGAYIDAVFNKYQGAPCYWGGALSGLPATCYVDKSTGLFLQNASGKPMPNSPKWKFDLEASQVVPLDFVPLSLILGGDYSFRSAAQMTPDQNPEARQGAFGILNLNATLLDETGNYSFTLFINNVANQHYVVDMEDFWSSPWSANAVIVQPARDSNRYFGAKFTASF